MQEEKMVKGLLVFAFISFLILLFFYFENEIKFNDYKISTTKQIDSLTTLSDSLRDEQFNLNVEIGRHEITREEMFTIFPNLQKKYESYYEHETE